MKLIVCDDAKAGLVAVLSTRTKWTFSDAIGVVQTCLDQLPDLAVLQKPATPTQSTAGVSEGQQEAFPFVLGGIPTPVGEGPQPQGVSKIPQLDDPYTFPRGGGAREAIPACDAEKPVGVPRLQKVDPRPKMDLDPDDEAGTNEQVKALYRHTEESRRKKGGQ